MDVNIRQHWNMEEIATRTSEWGGNNEHRLNETDFDTNHEYLYSINKHLLTQYNNKDNYRYNTYDVNNLIKSRSLGDMANEQEQDNTHRSRSRSQSPISPVTPTTPISPIFHQPTMDHKSKSTSSIPKADGKFPVDYSSFTFLLVDDNLINLFILKRILAKIFPNSKLVFTSDSTEVEMLLEQNKFDLIFLDIEMPILSGIDLTRMVRQRKDWDYLGLIAVTTRFSDADLQLYKSIGIDHTLKKPLVGDWDRLVDKVHTVIESRTVEVV